MTESTTPELPRLDRPQHGIRYVQSPGEWASVLDELSSGEGPIALDVERASGFRYSPRAYLVQLYRRGTTNYLVDPVEIPDLSGFTARFADDEWILHAARQDLPSLREVGIEPTRLFDTELAARIAGLARVGLQGSVEDLLGMSLAKEHSAADWSTRPLPEEWLYYAALDVEVLPDLRDVLHRQLSEQDKWRFAEEEFHTILTEPAPSPRKEPWRRLSGLHQVRGARSMAIARELWLAREELAEQSDVAPGRLIPDRSIVHAAVKNPGSLKALLALENFHGRASRKEAERWWQAIERGQQTEDLPALKAPGDTLPPPRAWADRAPEAYRRFVISRDLLNREAERLTIPAENVLTPEHLRRLCWEPIDPHSAVAIDQQLGQLGARRWQRDIAVPLLVEACSHAEELNASAN
jgi:ribonuclease D